jgi:hypothetical protein
MRATYAVISRINNAIIAASTVNPINGDGIKPSTKHSAQWITSRALVQFIEG